MKVIQVDPEIQGGLPCFAGTRVPIASLFDHIRQGITIDEFLLDFPSVSREQVDALLGQLQDYAEHDERSTGVRSVGSR